MNAPKPHIRPKRSPGDPSGAPFLHDIPVAAAHDAPLEPEQDWEPEQDPEPDRKDGARVLFNEGLRPG